MLYDFSFHNPTKIYFGKSAIDNLPNALDGYGKNVLFVYGGGSIKKSGLFDKLVGLLDDCGKRVTFLSGVTPNPRYSKVCEGCRLAKENKTDLILAVGGGSVIDCAKAIAALTHAEGNEREKWDKYFIGGAELTEPVIPLGTVLTMVGTGSEMNGGMVITDEETKIKTSMEHPETYPSFSLLDPELTYSLPAYQMKSGVFDALSHIMEIYFSPDDGDNLSDDVAEAIFKSLVRNLRAAIANPTDYVARSNLMWGATLALNGLISRGKVTDWEVHQIEHQIGAYTDCAHGMGLAAVSPAYYRAIYKGGVKQFAKYAVNVWGVDPSGKTEDETARAGIDALAAFIKECGICSSLRELGMTDKSLLRDIAYSCNTFDGGYKQLTHEEILAILDESF